MTAFLMVSSVPTIGWKRLRVPPSLRLFAIGGAGMIAALLLTAPWPVLLALALGYIILLPVGWISYRTIKRRREQAPPAAGA
jgi:CDP-diacylglycerol--serine O-phosphatidyltransferase